MLVDDEAVVIEIGSAMLIDLGYKVVTARDGKEAVEYYREHSAEIDLVILDMVMPEMGGRECYAELKKINPELTALLSTGFGINGRAQAIMDGGIDGFLQKPYRTDQLGKVVADVLKKK